MGTKLEHHFSKRDLKREVENQLLDEDYEYFNEMLSDWYCGEYEDSYFEV